MQRTFCETEAKKCAIALVAMGDSDATTLHAADLLSQCRHHARASCPQLALVSSVLHLAALNHHLLAAVSRYLAWCCYVTFG